VNILETLWRNRAINSLVKWFRINKVFDYYLNRFPLKKITPTGLVYKIENIPSLLVANEIFNLGVYRSAIEAVAPKTFVDLGANVGYFAIALADTTGSRNSKGLCIEANPLLRDTFLFHIQANNLENIRFIQGAVGLRGAHKEVDFFLNPSHIASSLSGKFNPLIPTGGKCQKIKVPFIELPEAWDRFFSTERVNMLKIDIEGAEIDFLRSHSSFLERVDSIVIEWHAWVTSLSDVKTILEQNGFLLENAYREDQNTGIALFRKSLSITPGS
jgi:FkbM family methyltransferase